MLPATSLSVTGRRFDVTYRVNRVAASPSEIADVARWMTGEMTVEFPLELLGDDDIARHVVGQVEDITTDGDGAHLVRISIAQDVVSGSMTQLLSVVWGNVSLAPGINLIDLQPPAGWQLPGAAAPRGLAAFRALADAPRRPLTMSAVKPLGMPAERLAVMAHDLATGGLDIVKEDQSLADQPWAPFDERVAQIADAVQRANAATGLSAVYAPSLNGPVTDLPRRAARARDVGAGAVMVQPGISGYPAIAAAAEAGLPVIAHPGGFGGLSDRVACRLVHGLLPRLAGADCSIFITPGGRFEVDVTDALATVRACLEPAGELPAIMPAAGGGITVEAVGQLRDTYGDDLCLLIGGDLHRDGNPTARAAALRVAVTA